MLSDMHSSIKVYNVTCGLFSIDSIISLLTPLPMHSSIKTYKFTNALAYLDIIMLLNFHSYITTNADICSYALFN